MDNYVAVVVRKVDTLEPRVLAAAVSTSKDHAIQKALQGKAARGDNCSRVLVGRLTEEVKQPIPYVLGPLEQKEDRGDSKDANQTDPQCAFDIGVDCGSYEVIGDITERQAP